MISLQERQRSMQCLSDNNYDYSKCQQFFSDFKKCKKEWVSDYTLHHYTLHHYTLYHYTLHHYTLHHRLVMHINIVTVLLYCCDVIVIMNIIWLLLCLEVGGADGPDVEA